jgi:hypothetical protein
MGQAASSAAAMRERTAWQSRLTLPSLMLSRAAVSLTLRPSTNRSAKHSQELLESQSRRLALRAPSTFVQRVLDVCGLVGLVEGDPAVGGLCPGTRGRA